LVFDASHFFVTNSSNHTTYRFPLTGGDFSSPESSADNGLNTGLGISGGHYYGNAATIACGGTTITNGLYSFDSNTLAVGAMIAPFTNPLAFVVDPLSPDPTNPNLFVSTCGGGGIFRVHRPNTSPTVTQFATGCFAGLYFTSDGSPLYAALYQEQHVNGFDRTGRLVLDVDLSGHGPDGIAVATANTVIGGIDVSNNVFVNSNDGTIERIDVNNGNAVSVVASGGSRGDFATVGADGCFYVTQRDRIVKLAPCFFQSVLTTTSTTATTTTSTTMTTLPPPCGPIPATGCQGAAAHKALLLVRKGETSAENQLSWKWTSSGTVSVRDFGTPTTSTAYVLCIYGNAALKMTARALAGRTCGTKPCWKAVGKTGFKYQDKSGTPDGLTGIQLKAGAAGKASIRVKGKGVRVPTLSLTTPVRVQLKRRHTGACWDATYSTALIDTASKLKAKSD